MTQSVITRTLICRLDPTPEQDTAAQAVLAGFATACVATHEGTPADITSRPGLHRATYRQVRAATGVPAQLAMRARDCVAAARTAARERGGAVRAFRPTRADYDLRMMTLRPDEGTVDLLTLERGRRITVPLRLSAYHREKRAGRQPASATVCRHRNGRLYLHLHLSRPAPPLAATPLDAVLGVDMERRQLAVSSDGHRFDGSRVTTVRDHYAARRRLLQIDAHQGTRSRRRRMRAIEHWLSGREARFQRHENHVISCRLVDHARQHGQAIALEDLTGIRARTNRQPRSRKERRRNNTWACYQLRQFVSYKAEDAGVSVLLVSPAYTSQICHRCLWLGTRSGVHFSCSNPLCGWSDDADDNAARMIACMGATVNRPRGPWLACPRAGASVGS